MSQLTLGSILPLLARHINTTFALQITDPQHPDYDGIVNPDWGLAAPGHATSFIAGCGFLYLAHIGHQRHALDLDPAELFARGSLAAEYLRRVQCPSGLIDLRDCNS